MEKLLPRPPWLVQRVPANGRLDEVRATVGRLGLHTVCQSADCPNIGECFGAGTATFLILGGICTRDCRFCAVPHGAPPPPDPTEPDRMADAVTALNLRHAVITSVTRDDLADGGAAQFAACIERLRSRRRQVTVEVLTPDFNGDAVAADLVFQAAPDIFNHNVETVPRLYAAVRPSAGYRRSLRLLNQAAERGLTVKSGLMVGLGETGEEVAALLRELAAAGVRLLTIGQYLRPSPQQLPVAEYVHPEVFRHYEELGLAAGVAHVAAGPLVRSSYHAGEVMARLRAEPKAVK